MLHAPAGGARGDESVARERDARVRHETGRSRGGAPLLRSTSTTYARPAGTPQPAGTPLPPEWGRYWTRQVRWRSLVTPALVCGHSRRTRQPSSSSGSRARSVAAPMMSGLLADGGGSGCPATSSSSSAPPSSISSSAASSSSSLDTSSQSATPFLRCSLSAARFCRFHASNSACSHDTSRSTGEGGRARRLPSALLPSTLLPSALLPSGLGGGGGGGGGGGAAR